MSVTRPFALVAEEKATVDFLKSFYEDVWSKYIDSVATSTCSSTDRRLGELAPRLPTETPQRRRLATLTDTAQAFEQITWALAHGLLKEGGAGELTKAFEAYPKLNYSTIEKLIDELKLPFDDKSLMFSFVFVPLSKASSETCAVDCSIYSTEHMAQCQEGRYRRGAWTGCKCGTEDQCVANTTALKTYDNTDGKSWYKALLSEYIFDTKCSAHRSSSKCKRDPECMWMSKVATSKQTDVICCKHSGAGPAECPTLASTKDRNAMGALTQTVKAQSAFMKTSDFMKLTSSSTKTDELYEIKASAEGDEQTQFGLQSLSNHLVAFVSASKNSSEKTWSKAEEHNICKQYRGSHCCPALDKDIRLSSTLGQPSKVREWWLHLIYPKVVVVLLKLMYG
jgi:hypothetical protein